MLLWRWGVGCLALPSPQHEQRVSGAVTGGGGSCGLGGASALRRESGRELWHRHRACATSPASRAGRARARTGRSGGVDGCSWWPQVVVCTAPPRTMAWKSPQSVNSGNRRPGSPAELALYSERIRPTAQAPAIRQRRSLKKTMATLPVPPPHGCKVIVGIIPAGFCRREWRGCEGVAGSRSMGRLVCEEQEDGDARDEMIPQGSAAAASSTRSPCA